MIRFEDALPELVRCCEQTPGFEVVARACAVRDLRGRVRLVLDAKDAAGLDTAALESALENHLGAYFQGPVWRADSGSPDERRLGQKLLDLGEGWEPTFRDPATGKEYSAPGQRWRKMERRLSKQAWLREAGVAPKPPWPLIRAAPAIVTFYSFKGGVGRTTALIACAWQLAEQGRRVAVVDLDLEAPGLGLLLGAESERGVVDYLVDYVATDSAVLDGVAVPAVELGESQERVWVLPAGRLNLAYLEKLARLDFNEDVPWDPASEVRAQQGLAALLKQIRKDLKPDYILLDSRAGLHDVAGLSLHGLSHVDVLLTRASEQGLRGLDLMLQLLSSEELRCAIVHAFAPAQRESEAEKEERAAFRQRVYELFRRHVYDVHYDDSDIPSEEAEDRPHSPLVLHQEEALRSITRIEAIREQLFSSDYQKLCTRVQELCEPEDAP